MAERVEVQEIPEGLDGDDCPGPEFHYSFLVTGGAESSGFGDGGRIAITNSPSGQHVVFGAVVLIIVIGLLENGSCSPTNGPWLVVLPPSTTYFRALFPT